MFRRKWVILQREATRLGPPALLKLQIRDRVRRRSIETKLQSDIETAREGLKVIRDYEKEKVVKTSIHKRSGDGRRMITLSAASTFALCSSNASTAFE